MEGTYSLMVVSPGSRELLADEDVEIVAGARVEKEITVSAEESNVSLMVAGSVLDPDGAPYADKRLGVSLDGGPVETIRSSSDGTFRFDASATPETVTVYGIAALFDPPVEPDVVTVQPGTTGVEFRITEVPDARTALFRVTDASNGEPVTDEQDVALFVYREAGARERVAAVQGFVLEGGTAEVEFIPSGTMRWAVSAPGYRERRGTFDLSTSADEISLIDVALEPGFGREVFVFDQRTGEPLADTIATDSNGNTIAKSGFDGAMMLEGREWPDWVRFEREGYLSLGWRVKSHWHFHSQRFWMEKLE